MLDGAAFNHQQVDVPLLPQLQSALQMGGVFFGLGFGMRLLEYKALVAQLVKSEMSRVQIPPKTAQFFSLKITGCFGCTHLLCILIHITANYGSASNLVKLCSVFVTYILNQYQYPWKNHYYD